MTHASLCTGIGACELAATWMGWENLFSCEIDEFCNKVLKHHYPKATHMETYSSKISENGGDELMSSRQVSLVNRSVAPESEMERKMTATSGQRCFVSSAKLDPLGLLVKTLVESSRWYSPARRLKWEVTRTFAERITRFTRNDNGSLSSKSESTSHQSDIQSNQLLYRLVPSERPTGETGCGFWQEGMMLPTPMATDIHHAERVKNLKNVGAETFHSRENGETRPNGLMDYLDFHDLLPTPMAQDYRRRGPNSEQQGLPEMAYNGMLPTPTAIDSGSGRINKSISPNAKERPTIALAAKMGLLPTTNASEATKYTKTYNPNSQMGQSLTVLAVNGMIEGASKSLTGKTSLQLNPLFVEEMMGMPLDYLVSPFQDGDKNR